jgi:hypothetical protein
MSDLLAKQQRFAAMVGSLIAWAYRQPGYGLTFGEAYRDPKEAQHNAETGAGIANSLHSLKLAVDLELFINGVWQTATPAYEPLGVYWESIGGSWGGRFHDRPDGNHFSLEYNGVR